MKKLVIKFGGKVLADPNLIQRAASIVTNAMSEGWSVVVVVSAMGATTDKLLTLADQISYERSERESDFLISAGEQISAALMAIALQSSGVDAMALTGGMAGIETDIQHGAATIKKVQTRRLEQLLNQGICPVIPGSQGQSRSGDITTLGRGGADVTALAIAGAMQAERCDIYTDVNAVYSADPKIETDARRLDFISYRQMLKLSAEGTVLNARAVELAMKFNIATRVRSLFALHDEGSLITTEESCGKLAKLTPRTFVRTEAVA